MTYDQNSIQIRDAGAFLVGQLEKLDTTLHLPSTQVTYARDIMLRTDVSIGHEASSWTNTTWGATGGVSSTGKSWSGTRTNNDGSISIATQKSVGLLTPWSQEVDWTIFEVEAALLTGTPIDVQKVTALKTKWDMDVDWSVYIGDVDLGTFGLWNNPNVAATNAVTGTWSTATPAQILADIREAEEAVWESTAFAYAPRKLALDPTSFTRLLQPFTVTTAGGTAGFGSIMDYIKANSLCNAINGTPLEIVPSKWLTAGRATSVNRFVVYTNDYDLVRFPLVPLAHSPVVYLGDRQSVTYYGRVGAVEFVNPLTAAYRDGN